MPNSYNGLNNISTNDFNKIKHNRDRLSRIITLVKDLCQQDLSGFITETREVCKYNQQHLSELAPPIRSQFPTLLEKYVNERS